MNDGTVETLVQQAQRGNGEAYARLVEQFHQRVYLLCLSRVHHVQQAEDLTQEVFMRALLKLRQLKKPASFGSWISTMARHLSLNALRDRRSAAALDADWPAPPDETEEHRDLHERVRRLPQELRLPLTLFYFDGRDARAVAQTLGVSLSTAYGRLRAALRSLHAMYLEEGGAP